MRTKILTPLLSFLLMQTASVMAANNQPQWADRLGVRLSPLNPAFEKYRSAQTAATKAQSSGPLNSREHRLGYIPPPFVFPANMGASGQTGVASANAAILPSRFDLRTSQPLGVTPVRNQYHCGSCWAFGTLGALESHLIYKKNKPTNYSEEDLILNNGFANGPCGGGNYAMAAAYLTRWGGPVSERDSPYAYWQGDWSWTIGSLGSNELPGGVTSPGSLSDTAGVTPPSPGIHIQKVKFLSASNQPLSTPERNTLKRAVMTDGAVGVIYWDMPFFYNESTSAFYNDTITDGNHAVTLVGWDDHFPRSAFNNSPPTDDYPFSVNPPPMDGAFIVKNSWGTEWGDEGYFYLSYFDTSLQQFTQFLEPETTSNYTRIYEYDPLGMVTAVGIDGAADPETAWMSNVFMASISAAKIKAQSESHENAMSTVFPTPHDRLLRDG